MNFCKKNKCWDKSNRNIQLAVSFFTNKRHQLRLSCVYYRQDNVDNYVLIYSNFKEERLESLNYTLNSTKVALRNYF